MTTWQNMIAHLYNTALYIYIYTRTAVGFVHVNFLSRTRTTKWQTYPCLSHIEVPFIHNLQSKLNMHELQHSFGPSHLIHVLPLCLSSSIMHGFQGIIAEMGFQYWEELSAIHIFLSNFEKSLPCCKYFHRNDSITGFKLFSHMGFEY